MSYNSQLERIAQKVERYRFGTRSFLVEGIIKEGFLLPECKAGDTLYGVTDSSGVHEYTVSSTNLHYETHIGGSYYTLFMRLVDVQTEKEVSIHHTDIGRFYFYSKEEAERVFEEGKSTTVGIVEFDTIGRVN